MEPVWYRGRRYEYLGTLGETGNSVAAKAASIKGNLAKRLACQN